jgi:hypothetical protein
MPRKMPNAGSGGAPHWALRRALARGAKAAGRAATGHGHMSAHERHKFERELRRFGREMNSNLALTIRQRYGANKPSPETQRLIRKLRRELERELRRHRH